MAPNKPKSDPRKGKVATGSRTAKKKTTPKKNITKSAKFKLNTKDSDGNQSFDQIIGAGWVHEPVILGRLTRIHHGANRVVFEFQLNNIKFDAWSGSSNGWDRKNIKLLKVGNKYILEGSILAKPKIAKYSRSSNSNFKFEVNLSKVTVVKEEKNNEVMQLNEVDAVKQMNQRIKSGIPFNLIANDLEIISGDLRRYMGCEICYTGIRKPDKNGNYYCRMCIRTSKGSRIKLERRVCVIITDLKLRDKNGNSIEKIICYQRMCEFLFGCDVLKRLCGTSSDLVARDAFAALTGTKVNATIIGQIPTTARRSQTAFNEYKVVVIALELLGPTRRDSILKVCNRSEQHNIAQIDPVEDGNLCECGHDEDDDDEVPLTGNFDIDMDVSNHCENENNSSTTPVSLNYPIEKCYALTPNKDDWIGLALVINMTKKRDGSNFDVKRLQNLFPKLGVKIYKDKVFQNIKKDAFHATLDEFKNELVQGKYSSLFFVFMGHGSLYSVLLKDNDRLNVYKDIFSSFGETNFPNFNGKPKMFFINSCQHFPLFKDTETGTMTEYSFGWQVDDTQEICDVLECYPCSPGVKAKRCTDSGSYFIQTLADVLEGNWKYMHIEEMMKELQERMRKKRLGDSQLSINIPVYKPVVFSKNFYFAAREANSEGMPDETDHMDLSL